VRRAAGVLAAWALVVPAGALAQAPGEESPPGPAPATPTGPSKAIGKPWHGRLVNGVQVPEAGPGFLTWDDPLNRIPNRPDRRWGTTALVRITEEVLARYQEAHPDALPVLVGDLSRPHGGVFDKRYGGLGHASHQNGLDVDVYYPRLDRRLRSAWRPDQVDRVLAQDLVDRFVAAGAQRVFVGARVGLHGPRRIVAKLAHHEDHLHVRIPNPG
jgi:murein endopeptidase